MWRSLSVVLLLTLAGCAAGQQAASPPTASTTAAPASSDLPSPAASLPLASSSAPTAAPSSPTHSAPPRSSSPARTADLAGIGCTGDDVYTYTDGQPVHETARLGDSVATLTGTSVASLGSANGLRSGRIVVQTAGRGVLSAAVGPTTDGFLPQLFDFSFYNVAPDNVRGPLCLARFSTGGPLVTLLMMTTGGAHCCGLARAYIVPTSSATKPVATKPIEQGFGNAYATVGTDAGAPLIVSADDAFYYAFGSYADSLVPIALYTVKDGAFVNVTTAHPALVRTDAEQQWKVFADRSTNPAAVISSLAAWVADQCMLGNANTAWQTVAKYSRLGRLTSPDTGYATGDAYISDLEIFLADHNYCPPVGAAAATPRPSFSGFDPAAIPPLPASSS